MAFLENCAVWNINFHDFRLTETGEGPIKRGYKKKKTLKEIVLFDPNEEETDDDEEVLLEKRREASHDLDWKNIMCLNIK